jgi:Zn-dependent protease with chaperone function
MFKRSFAIRPAKAAHFYGMFSERLHMEYTGSELAVIADAKKKIYAATIVRGLIVIAMLVAIVLMATGTVIADRLIYGVIAAVFLAVAYPQFGAGPKYEDLVRLLESKSKDQHIKP